jgi:predicted NAD-dependent protein-ADP-ribosyltransferase YbiA (DUF1768 family)
VGGQGRRVPLRADWEAVKYNVMQDAIRAKFSRGSGLADALLATGDAYLQEGNTWGDRTWGVTRGHGRNWLGYILMGRRAELSSEQAGRDAW